MPARRENQQALRAYVLFRFCSAAGVTKPRNARRIAGKPNDHGRGGHSDRGVEIKAHVLSVPDWVKP